MLTVYLLTYRNTLNVSRKWEPMQLLEHPLLLLCSWLREQMLWMDGVLINRELGDLVTLAMGGRVMIPPHLLHSKMQIL